jgi:hypothetical protein
MIVFEENKLPNDIEVTCIHEAAHALVAAHFGLKIERATIRPKRGEYRGVVTIDSPNECLLLVLLAGHVAERLVYGREQSDIGKSNDWKQACVLASRLWPGPVLEKLANLERAVEQLLRRNRATLDRLADELYKKISLSGEEIRAIVSPSSKQSRSAVKSKAPPHPDRGLPQPGDFRTSNQGRISRVGRDVGRVVPPTGEKIYRQRNGAIR